MALPTARNLGSLRKELKDRLGFGAIGASAGANNALIDSFLRTAQELLYWEYTPRSIIETNSTVISQDGQNSYTWPDDVNIDKIIQIVVEDTSISAPNRYPLYEGIEWTEDNYNTPKDKPSRYEVRAMLEVWPQPDNADYIFHIEYVKRLGNFTLDGDFVTLDADLVLLLALSNAKAHYRHPDSSIYVSQVTRLLGKLKGAGLGKKRFVRGSRNISTADDEFYNRTTHRNVLD
jgi:hypothetical protein